MVQDSLEAMATEKAVADPYEIAARQARLHNDFGQVNLKAAS